MRRLILWSILVSALAGVLISFMLSLSKHEPAGPALTLRQARGERAQDSRTARLGNPAPGLTGLGLTDQEGRPFDENRLEGRAWIADFIFTSCAGTCPGMSAKMASLQQRLPPEVLLVSFSVDPKRDTPTVLAEYARRYGAQPGRWFFLTGMDQDLVQGFVQHGFNLSAAEGGSPEEPIIHSVRFVLVDRAWKIRGYYDSTDPEMLKQLEEDAKALAK